MLKLNKSTIKATKLYSDDAVKIRSGSFVFANNWINFKGTLFKVNDYVSQVVQPPRTRFFSDRGYAVYLVIGLDIDGNLSVLEGTHVKFTSLTSVPAPSTFNVLPLVGIILIQDGSSDLNLGYKPLNDTNVIFFSGVGNVVDKNKKGDKGPDNGDLGDTGLLGYTGIPGEIGDIGLTGSNGYPGIVIPGESGPQGPQGVTGSPWDIHVPFQVFI